MAENKQAPSESGRETAVVHGSENKGAQVIDAVVLPAGFVLPSASPLPPVASAQTPAADAGGDGS
jgi:hypothetical protein